MKRIERFLGLIYTSLDRPQTRITLYICASRVQPREASRHKFLTHILITPPSHLTTSAGQLSASSREMTGNTNEHGSTAFLSSPNASCNDDVERNVELMLLVTLKPLHHVDRRRYEGVVCLNITSISALTFDSHTGLPHILTNLLNLIHDAHVKFGG